MTLWEWRFHEVTTWSNEFFVRKNHKPSDTHTVDAQSAQTSLDVHIALFGKFNPKTKVVPSDNWYCVVQKRIHWKTLQDSDTEELNISQLNDLLNFLDLLERAVIKWYIVDYYGQQENTLHRPELTDSSLLNIVNKLRYLREYWKYYHDIFKSTNIMVENWWWVYFVDNVDMNSPIKRHPLSPWILMRLIVIQYYKYNIRKHRAHIS